MGELYWQVELDYTLRLPKVPKATFDINNFLNFYQGQILSFILMKEPSQLFLVWLNKHLIRAGQIFWDWFETNILEPVQYKYFEIGSIQIFWNLFEANILKPGSRHILQPVQDKYFETGPRQIFWNRLNTNTLKSVQDKYFETGSRQILKPARDKYFENGLTNIFGLDKSKYLKLLWQIFCNFSLSKPHWLEPLILC